MKRFLLAVTLAVSAITLMAQGVVTGKVVDADNGEGLPGATIRVEGTTLGTISDVNGEFSLNVPSRGSVLIIS